MMRRLERGRSESRLAATLLRAPAEDLPFEDDSFAAAVSTLVLCTVDDQSRALRQLRRGPKPEAACSSSSTFAPTTGRLRPHRSPKRHPSENGEDSRPKRGAQKLSRSKKGL